MGQWRRSGQVVESSSAPKLISTFSRPSRLFANDGTTKKQLNHGDVLGADVFGSTGQNSAAVGDIFEMDFYAQGNETELDISTGKNTSFASWDLFVNGTQQRNFVAISTGGKAYQDNGGVWTDDTTDAGDAGAGDVPAFAAPDTVNDAFYFGFTHPFSAIKINVDTPSDGGSYIWEYWNGAAYVVLTNLSGEAGLSTAGTSILTFDVPMNWAANDPDGGGVVTSTLYYVRQRRLIAFGAVLPVYTQVWLDNGYDDYAAAAGLNHRQITGLSFNPGYNLVQIKGNGKQVSSSNFWISVAGVSIQ